MIVDELGNLWSSLDEVDDIQTMTTLWTIYQERHLLK